MCRNASLIVFCEPGFFPVVASTQVRAAIAAATARIRAAITAATARISAACALATPISTVQAPMLGHRGRR